MAAKRRARRPRPDDSEELGRNGGNEEEEEEECGKSGETAMSAERKERPLKQAEQPSPPSTEDAGARGSVEASPARSAPRGGGVALKTKTTSKHIKKSPPASQEEDEAGDSGDASPARDPLPDNNKRAVTPKREKRSLPLQQGEEHADEEEQQGEGIPHREQPNDISPSQEKKRYQDDKETGAQVNSKDLQGRNAPPRSSETEKKPAVERSWSYNDELKILNALVKHAQSHNGALPDSSHLLANLTFDKIDATEDKLTDKIRKLRTRYYRFLSQGYPSDDLSRRLFKLSGILWGQVDEDKRVEPTSRDFSVLSKLYPHLAKEVRAYDETHSSGDLVMSMFMTIGDEKARDLDAKCKKQHIEAFKLELGQASLTNELLSALSSLTTKIADPSQATPCKRSANKPLDEQYSRRSKRVSGKTEGFKDKPNADEVLNPKPLAMVPAPNSPVPPPHQGHCGVYCHWFPADSA